MFSTVNVSSAIVLLLTLLTNPGGAENLRGKSIKTQLEYNSSIKGDPRIVGGEPVPSRTYPWFSLPVADNMIVGCGGMLVAPEFVLTTAMCKDYNTIAIGVLCLANDNCGQPVEIIPMSGQPIIHPQYNANTL